MPKGALPMPTMSRIAPAKQRNEASCRFDIDPAYAELEAVFIG